MRTQAAQRPGQAAYGGLNGRVQGVKLSALVIQSQDRFTFAEDLQQLVGHFSLQLFSGSTSAPEAPAKPQR